ncbi:NEDD4-like E3 ubiquitin-protein ligase WWP1 isoform 1 [Schistosoma japonicum]|uniref:E3 ubiquitin-protein ligase n=2 Tax=Schistosoma japonicum TaxID=6182 RepID=A0A4Z2CMR7_SCHJA|nr:NEDD4-like E3 ubiquitin-protein ligase WWP1 [Schistosoma japonicum]KAH8864535.1 NEDD4-like E3 ubiquitin-protein ligase WWP1 [Schistosoma japonicum]TNN05522.1 NEDD4-like E3 ubiquitin-protein ligase WWP1 isoform 1 [Schistosoma japonicum]
MLTICDTALSRRLSQLVITVKCATFSQSCKSLFSKSGDLFADLLVDDTFVYKTKICPKTWNPTWNESVSVVASPKSTIQIKVFNHFKLGPDVLVAVAAINLFSILIEHNGVLSKCELRLSLFQGCDYKGSVFVILDKLKICVQSLENESNILDNLSQIPCSSNRVESTSIQHQSPHHHSVDGYTTVITTGTPHVNGSNLRGETSISNPPRVLINHHDKAFWSALIGSLFGSHKISSRNTLTTGDSTSRAQDVELPDRQRPLNDWTEVDGFWETNNLSTSSSLSTSNVTSQNNQTDASLPPGWERRFDKSTQKYYFVNHKCKITQWEDPRERGMDETQPLPPGWEKRYTAQGQRFFIDHNTHTTTLVDPRTGQHAGSLGSMGVPLQYERNFRSKVNYFRACCTNAMLGGQTKLLISRDNLLEDSFQLVSQMSSSSLRRRLSITFLHEEGLDYGGVAREWFYRLSREILNPMFGLFEYTGTDYALQVNPASHVNPNHMTYFRFVGRFIGMALFHGRCIDGGLTLAFYKQILKRKLTLEDLGHTDHSYYQSLIYIRDNPVDECDLDLYFVGTYDLLGEMHEDELIEGGKDIKVTDENKFDYIRLMVDWRFNRGVTKQTEEIHKGIFEVLNPEWLELFDEREFELLLSGMPEIDVDDWEKNTVYLKYTRSSKQIIWFWKLVRKLDNEHRARLLQFVTGTCHLPLGGFSELIGSGGRQLFCIERTGDEHWLPRSHTCFNRLDLPPYSSYDQLYEKLQMAIEETKGFGQE